MKILATGPSIRRIRGNGFAAAALLALVVLALGTAGHFAHHLLDPHCGEERNAPHPCACSVLHGAAVVQAEVRVAPTAPAHDPELRFTHARAAHAPVLGRYAPRPPPLV